MTAHLPGREGGFSLVELMVAMLIGLFLTSGLVYTYIGSKRSYSFNEAMSRMQENGRFAIHFLSRDIREAGYTSCAQRVGRTQNLLDLSGSDAYLWQFDTGIDGIDDRGSDWSSTDLSNVISKKPTRDTDVITVRAAAGAPVGLATAMSSATDAIDVDTSNDFEDGDVLLITDCVDAAIFQAMIAGATADLEHDTSGSSPGNRADDLGKAYDADSHVMHMTTSTYFIADSDYAHVPSLWRQANDDISRELVRGVADMQILYGEDTDGDRTADRYVNAAAVSDMDDVVSVRLALLITSLTEVASEAISYDYTSYGFDQYNDRYLRRVFVATVNLRNRSP